MSVIRTADWHLLCNTNLGEIINIFIELAVCRELFEKASEQLIIHSM